MQQVRTVLYIRGDVVTTGHWSAHVSLDDEDIGYLRAQDVLVFYDEHGPPTRDDIVSLMDPEGFVPRRPKLGPADHIITVGEIFVDATYFAAMADQFCYMRRTGVEWLAKPYGRGHGGMHIGLVLLRVDGDVVGCISGLKPDVGGRIE